MKKSLICVILLAVLSLGGIITAHVTIAATADQVEITQRDLFGDPHAADGLVVNRKAMIQGPRSMHWDTVYPVGGTPETVYTYDEIFIPDRQENRLYINSDTLNQGYSGRWEYPITEPDVFLRELFNDVAENTPAGKTRKEVLNLRDYMEFIPTDIILSFDIPDKQGTLRHININTDEFWRFYRDQDPADARDYPRYQFALELADAFLSPVSEDMTVSISITRDSEGTIVDMECNAEHDYLNISSEAADTGDWIYFTVYGLTDYTNTPAGFGVYRLPIRDPAQLTLDDLDLVLSLDSTEQDYLSLAATPEQDRVLLTTRENGHVVLRILDSSSGDLLQALELDTIQDDDWPSVIPYDGFAVLYHPNGRRVLEELPDGTYRPRFMAEDPDPEAFPELDRWYDSGDLAFDGQRLAVFRGDSSQYEGGCGFGLLVYDETGLIYVGQFSHSLDAGMGWEEYYDSIVHPFRHDSCIHWA